MSVFKLAGERRPEGAHPHLRPVGGPRWSFVRPPPRVLVLPLAAIVITGLCVWRMTRPPRPVPTSESSPRAYPPKEWELIDQHRHLVKFQRYLGRQPLVVRFLGTAQRPEEDAVLVWLRDHYAAVQRAGWEVVAIGTARPAEIEQSARESGREWPFPVLTDLFERDPTPTPVHRLWQRIDPETGEPLAGLYLVDRLGYVPYDMQGRPQPVAEPLSALERLFGE